MYCIVINQISGDANYTIVTWHGLTAKVIKLVEMWSALHYSVTEAKIIIKLVEMSNSHTPWNFNMP